MVLLLLIFYVLLTFSSKKENPKLSGHDWGWAEPQQPHCTGDWSLYLNRVCRMYDVQIML